MKRLGWLSLWCGLCAWSSVHGGERFVMAALGDSVTQAMNADGWGAQTALSWSSGDAPGLGSIRQRLAASLPQTEVVAFNVSRSGAKARDLSGQMTQLAQQVRPDFATVLMGGNDLCHWDYSAAAMLEYKGHIERTVNQLIARNPQVRVLLLPIPNMLRLRERGLGRGQSCQNIWDLFNVCPNLLPTQRSTADRLRFAESTRSMNQTLAGIAQQYSQVKFAAQAQDTEFYLEHISRTDCFHPSLKGQKLIAETAWEPRWMIHGLSSPRILNKDYFHRDALRQSVGLFDTPTN